MASSTPLSKANTTFCLDLFKKLSDNDKTANVFYSPFSISAALAMVMLGARGNTYTQMSEVLAFTERERLQQEDAEQSQTQSQMQSQIETRRRIQQQIQQQSKLPRYLQQCLKPANGNDDVHEDFAKLLSELNKEDPPYALSIANRLYGEQSYKFVEDYLADTKKYYMAELESVDFKNNFEAARVNINRWVEDKTEGKIKDLLVKDVLNEMTRLVLVNAIYFKGNWEAKFDEDATSDAQFRINKKDTKPVKMMDQTHEFPLAFIPEVNCKVLEMPYKGEDLSMLILLPNEIEDDTTGLEKLEKELTYEKFVEWTSPDKMNKKVVKVHLPRFKMEEKYDLKTVLMSMGMTDAFDVENSDFSGMSSANNLFLSKVVHKAFMEVNEEGTESGAGSGAVIETRSVPVPFNADHPFLFFIRHNSSKSILFAGRYCSPE
ncbi:leukocyte elastase inhibitor-like [Symphorus nematophorus]